MSDQQHRPFDQPAEMQVVYVLHGERIDPPTFDHLPPDAREDARIGWDEDFQFRSGGTVRTQCSADGSRVYPSIVRPTHEQFCERGHRWILASNGLDNQSRAEIAPYWRQVP